MHRPIPSCEVSLVDDTALGRSARLLDAACREPLRFSQAQALLGGLAPSSLNRLLKNMLALGMLERDDDGHYVLGPRLARWQRQQDRDLRNLAAATLDTLTNELHVTSSVWTRVGNDLACLDRRLDESSPALSEPGSVRPLRFPVVGAPIFMDEGELADDRTILTHLRRQGMSVPLSMIKRIVVEYRRSGYIDDNGAFFCGVRRFAAPVRVQGEPVAAIGLGVSHARARDDEFRNLLVRRLTEECRALERQLNTEPIACS